MRIARISFPLGVVALVGLSVAACFHRIWAVDFWWQYATGRLVLSQGWPAVDVFSYTAAGQPWIELRWLFCVVQASVMDGLGTPALQVLLWLSVVAAFTLVTWPHASPRVRAFVPLVVGVALLTSAQRFLMRPELVTFVMFATFLLVLDRHRRAASRWIWALPFLQLPPQGT